MGKDTVISARVSREFRDRFDRIAVSLGARDRSSGIKLALRHFMTEYEAGRIRRVDRRQTDSRRTGGDKNASPHTRRRRP